MSLAPAQTRPTRIAFAGLGRMGLPMCARLVAAGFAVVATDVRRSRRPAAEALGASWADSLTEACPAAEVLVTMLPGPGEVAAMISEVGGALASGGCWIDMSSATPAVARAIAATLPAQGIRAIDAPVGGGPSEAATGGLLAFAGGGAEAVVVARPVLDVLSRRVMHVGPAGSGYAVKLLVNGLWFTQAVATAEALAVGARLGLDLDVLRDALGQSAAGGRFLDEGARALLDGDDLTTFSLARCCEELDSVLALGSEVGAPLELAAVVAALHRTALARYGDVDGELLGARLVAARAGVRLARGQAPDQR